MPTLKHGRIRTRRDGVPGGNRPPLGYLRVRSDPTNPRPPQQLVADPATAPVIGRAFDLSASGLTDREVAAATGLRLTHVREILKNPVYVGQLRTGEASGGPALITKALVEEASAKASTKVVPAAVAVAWLHDLPALWAGADDSGRCLLTEAIFEKVEVLGVQSVTIHPTPEADAHGWSEAFGTLPPLLNAGRAF